MTALVRAGRDDTYGGVSVDDYSHYADTSPDPGDRTYCNRPVGRVLLNTCPWDLHPNCPTCVTAHAMRVTASVRVVER